MCLRRDDSWGLVDYTKRLGAGTKRRVVRQHGKLLGPFTRNAPLLIHFPRVAQKGISITASSRSKAILTGGLLHSINVSSVFY